METNRIKIDDNFCFDTKKHLSIADFQKALKLYSSKFDEVLKLEGDMPIFLDTNILLGYYQISLEERKKLKQFFIKYKDRIYITHQIEKEFLRNRIKVIKEFYGSLRKVKSEFETIDKEIHGFKTILNKFKSLSEKKFLKYDYPNSYKKIGELKDIVKANLDKFYNDVNSIYEENKNIVEMEINQAIDDKNFKEMEIRDEILDVFSQFKVIDSLENADIQFIEKQYDSLLEQYKKINKDKDKDKYTFPGRGDQNEKDYPYGDLIIYHEMLKFCFKKETSVIFVTKDVSKKDWLQGNGKPYIHYIENAFLNTGQVIFILDGERLLKELLKISLDKIYEEGSEEYKGDIIDPLWIDDLLDLCDQYPPAAVTRSWDWVKRRLQEIADSADIDLFPSGSIMLDSLDIEPNIKELILEFYEIYKKLSQKQGYVDSGKGKKCIAMATDIVRALVNIEPIPRISQTKR